MPGPTAAVLASALQPRTRCALPQGRPGMNGLKGEKGEPGDVSVGFGMRVSVQRHVRGGAGATRPQVSELNPARLLSGLDV